MILRLPDEQALRSLEDRIQAKLPKRVHVTGVPSLQGNSLTSTEWKREKGLADPVRKVLRTFQKRSGAPKRKSLGIPEWSDRLKAQIVSVGLQAPEREYRFHEVRMWRFDLAWPVKRIAVEIMGGIWNQGRHTRGAGYMADMQKFNEANRSGWHIYQFTPSEVKKGRALAYMLKVLA